nr:arf-GAP with Rho-GAP domain, ANK repeat and PH domain-containing protein 1-like [Anolis sagrei ordinatus]
MAAGSSLPMAEWLRALHLEQYVDNFERSDLRCVSDCQRLTDEDLTQLGILLPGHRKRILSGLLKAFAESLPSLEGPQLPPRRPVPMKRNIFRGSCVPAPSSSKATSPSCPDPPPIPPRTTCHPPVKFSSPPALSESPPSVPSFESGALMDFSAPLATPPDTGMVTPVVTVFPDPAGKAIVLPPLPAKRHHLEGKAPPLPSRPPTLPPRAGQQKATGG